MNMNRNIIVAEHQGNIYSRDMSNCSTVYSDRVIASFDTQAEADAFITENYGEHAYDESYDGDIN